jgi:hypothetical protein
MRPSTELGVVFNAGNMARHPGAGHIVVEGVHEQREAAEGEVLEEAHALGLVLARRHLPGLDNLHGTGGSGSL